MSLTNKALFIIERNLNTELTLEQVASHCDVSRFHLAHAFGEATGLSLMDYVRGRRLSEAATALASGAGNILAVALDTRYASHEAFSRAFKARFDRTPEEVRTAGTVDELKLIDALRHLESKQMKIKEPQFETIGKLLFVGQSERVAFGATETIAGQWQRFMTGPYGDIDHKIDEPPVGVTTAASDDGIVYVCATGVTSFGNIPKGCEKLTLAPATYAVFSHDGHIAYLRDTFNSIWNDWFPKSSKTPAEAPTLERHNPTFDPRTGEGGVTLWIPIAP